MRKLVTPILGLGTLLLSACAFTPTSELCAGPQGKRLDEAFREAREALGHEQCRARFGDYFNRLLVIAEGEPGSENFERFSDFIGWSHDQGVLSRLEGQKLYTQHFSPKFVALPDDRSACSATREFDTIRPALDAELRAKHQGLSKVGDSPGLYSQALAEKTRIEEIFDALVLACE